jgi:hypothetical protein
MINSGLHSRKIFLAKTRSGWQWVEKQGTLVASSCRDQVIDTREHLSVGTEFGRPWKCN